MIYKFEPHVMIVAHHAVLGGPMGGGAVETGRADGGV